VSALSRQLDLSNLRITGAIVARLLLVVSMWHAPIPILHAHTLSLSETAGNHQLADHLVAFHRDDRGSTLDRDREYSDLHWHFIIPDFDGCCSKTGQGSHHHESASPVWKFATNSTPHASITASTLSELNLIASGNIDWNAVPLPHAPSFEVERGHTGYLHSFASQGKISLQELLSRRLC